VTLLPLTGGRQHPIAATRPKAFHEGTGRMLSRCRQYMLRHLWHTSKISRKFAGERNWVQMIFEMLHLPRTSSLLLGTAPFWSLIDMAISEFLLRRCRMVWPNTLLACHQLQSSVCLKLPQDCLSDFFAVSSAHFHASAYGVSKEDLALFWNQAF